MSELISGADALRALAEGREIEGFSDAHEKWIPIVYFTVQEVINGSYKFRLKPRTIKFEIEVPAPFEPKVGEKYFFLSSNGYGYDETTFSNDDLDKEHLMYGAWRTESDIIIVVEQLRKLGVLK